MHQRMKKNSPTPQLRVVEFKCLLSTRSHSCKEEDDDDNGEDDRSNRILRTNALPITPL